MASDLRALIEAPQRETVARHDARDVILYALGIGTAQRDPLSPAALQYAYEEGLKVLPTMGTVLATPGFWMQEPQFGLDWRKVLHGEQSTHFHRPIPTEGELTSKLVVEDVIDKGPAKGAVLYSRRDIYDTASGDLLVTDRRATFLRGDGGKGGTTKQVEPLVGQIPERAADTAICVPTREDQALLYRLSGDYNPLHADPAVARAVGFDRPILHGLCTYGIAGSALLSALCDDDPARLRQMDCRFTAPVYPGETIKIEIWHDGSELAAFRASSLERDLVVLDRGRAILTQAETDR